MNQSNDINAYFPNEMDAKQAAADLSAQGCDADVHSEMSAGEKFMDMIKSVFSGEDTTDRHRTGAVLRVKGGAANMQMVQSIIQRYNGQMSGMPAAGTTSTTGEIDYRSVTERERAPAGGTTSERSDLPAASDTGEELPPP